MEPDLAPTVVAVLVVGLIVGALLGWLAARTKASAVEAQRAVLQARCTALDGERAGLQDRVQRSEASLSDGRELAMVVAPLRETLHRVESQLRDLERARVSAYAALTEQVGSVARTSEQLRVETGALVTALRAPQVRGRWGEMQLRRVVEVAGMLERCDFDEQPTVRDGDRLQRPDMVVHLAGAKHVVVDAKVPLTAYLEAAEATDGDVRADRLAAHARQLRAHVNGLAAKEYWARFRPSPEFVVLFVPGEAFLAPALEQDPSLLEDAMRRQVVVATPTTLLAMLRTIAYAWQQEAVSEHAREVLDLGQELYARLGTLGMHVDKIGRALRRAVEDYNATVGSLERSILAPARRLAELSVTDRELPRPSAVDACTRPLTAPELLGAAGEARVAGDARAGGDLRRSGDARAGSDEDEPRLRALPEL